MIFRCKTSEEIPALSILLAEELFSRKLQNSSYSMRAFARSLQLSPSYLSKLMKGKRLASKGTLIKVGRFLKLEQEELALLYKSHHEQINVNPAAKELIQLDPAKNWHFFAILELAKMSDFLPTPESLSKSLSISSDRARSAISRLIAMGLLKKAPEIATSKVIGTKKKSLLGVKSAHLYHEKQILEGAILALDQAPENRQYHGSMLFSLPLAKFEELKDHIRQLQQDLPSMLQVNPNSDSPYQISVSVYPVQNET